MPQYFRVVPKGNRTNFENGRDTKYDLQSHGAVTSVAFEFTEEHMVTSPIVPDCFCLFSSIC